MSEKTRSWTVKVPAGGSAMIAPAFTKDPMSCPKIPGDQGDIIEKGGYYRSYAWDFGGKYNQRFYWTPNGGECYETPTHHYGCKEYSDGIVWVVVGLSRNYLDISADVANPVFLIDSGLSWELPYEAGLKLDEYRPAYTYENFNGEVYAVAESGEATIGVKER